MKGTNFHQFHIPVMGLGFTIDTPVKVAHYGINSVVSIIEDHLLERMRNIVSREEGLYYEPIQENSPDHRARRVTAYLDMLKLIVERNTLKLKAENFSTGEGIRKYFLMLPTNSQARQLFLGLDKLSGEDRNSAEQLLRKSIHPGSIDVNIMTKVDRQNFAGGKPLPQEYSDAHAALRGFAGSGLSSSIVFSAGLNPRLYNYCASFPDFLPQADGSLKKKIIVKVSDYRSAHVQGKFFAKKGLWVSEFRIESGLNCGGHAFATEGSLLGPILNEFRVNREALAEELLAGCNLALAASGHPLFPGMPSQKITVQGGIGTSAENEFLLKHYRLDGTGWGSPFLLVPEATSVDTYTREALATAEQDDYYLSHASSLGIPFNNFKKSTSEAQRKHRIEKNRPGSPCYKKFLAFDKEFTEHTICTVSREYQNLKIKQVQSSGMAPDEKLLAVENIIEKDCLCEGLAAPAILAHGETPEHKLKATSICPGPNLAYFSGTFSLAQMADHIYGRINALNGLPRPHMFVNELKLYLSYLAGEIKKCGASISPKQASYFDNFRKNLFSGIDYYENLLPILTTTRQIRNEIKGQLEAVRNTLCEPQFIMPGELSAAL